MAIISTVNIADKIKLILRSLIVVFIRDSVN